MASFCPVCVVASAPARVVSTPSLTIDELAGNVASKSDQLSIAYVCAKAGSGEPWLTLHYDEWICIRSGEICFEYADKKLLAKAGETVFIRSGTRFRPTFPVDTEYIPVCLPAFRPDRCLREDEEEEQKNIASKLKDLHKIFCLICFY